VPGTYIAGIDPILMIDSALTANADYVLEMSAALAPSTPVPEPSTWALMTFGFGALGRVGYRASRRSQATA
jgi:PEP-CTERM motif